MDILDFAERLANSFSYRMHSVVSSRRHRRDYDCFLKAGMRPFTPGYDVYKWQQIQEALANSSLLELFRDGRDLPVQFGSGIDERIVEYPWLLSRLEKAPGTVLDAGSALNFELLVNQPILEQKAMHVLTLHPESNCFWKRGISYVFADLRDLPLRDRYYDQVVCISTLEHVGLNTEIYTSKRIEHLLKGDYKLAARELWRVLKPGGRLYLTMPFGKVCSLDWLQQFDEPMISDLTAMLQPQETSITYYSYNAAGWKVSTAAGCGNCEYTDPDAWKSGSLSSSQATPVAAGAIVCLDLLK